jgi:chaperonin GroEL (HSP60 family)
MKALHDAQCVVARSLENPLVVPGGGYYYYYYYCYYLVAYCILKGATEIETSIQLESYAVMNIKSRLQAVVVAFSKALLCIPSLLASNSGLDVIEKLAELQSFHRRDSKVDDNSKISSSRYLLLLSLVYLYS